VGRSFFIQDQESVFLLKFFLAFFGVIFVKPKVDWWSNLNVWSNNSLSGA